MTQQVVNVTEGQPLNASLGFVANSVTINNITQSWAYVSAAQQFIPPYQYGVVLNLPGTDTGDIVWQTPTSLPVGPVGSGTLTATYTTATLTPSNGMSVFTQQTQVLFRTVPPLSFVNLTVPAVTQAVMLIPQTSAGSVQYIVTAPPSGTFPGESFGTGVGATGVPVIVPISTVQSNVIQVQNNSGAAIFVVALFTSQSEPVQTVSITGSVSTVVTSANITAISGSPLTLGQEPMAGSLPVVIASNQSEVAENLTQIGGNAVSNVVPGTLDINIKDVAGSPSGVLSVNIADLNAGSAVGQQNMANSFPVVLASNQSAIPTTTTPGVGNGQELMASSAPVVIASDQSNLPENLVQVAGVGVRTAYVTAPPGNLNGVVPVAGARQVAGAGASA